MNEWQPGLVLTELSLAAQLSSSQASIREALLRLEGEGMVTRSGHQGTTVTNLGAVEAAEILGLRRRIEGRGRHGDHPHRTTADLPRLQALLADMRAAAADDDLWAMVQADTEFHLALFRISGLHAMEPILSRCILHTHRFRLWAPWHRRPLIDTADRHLPILAAVESGDAKALRHSVEVHLDTIVDTKSGIS